VNQGIHAEQERVVSVIVPAHNEASSIGRLLKALTRGCTPGELDIVVVCNGCSDETATVASGFAPLVRVVETTVASKRIAQQLGDQASLVFPRAYVDADVVLAREDLRRLVEALARPGIMATAPRRRLRTDRSGVLVRAYYRVWERLPHVREGLFGRGVLVVSEAGYERVSSVPAVLSDDLAMAEAFAASETRVVLEAEVEIIAPRNTRDLVRRRLRVTSGNAQADQLGLRRPSSRTSPQDLTRLIRAEPRLISSVLVFASITLVARLRSRHQIRAGDFTTWQRDESSRQGL
jgi:glycosyltransferase involved in cell wall biosynthesis